MHPARCRCGIATEQNGDWLSCDDFQHRAASPPGADGFSPFVAKTARDLKAKPVS